MKTLNTLIKVKRKELDEKRILAGQLEGRMQNLKDGIVSIDRQVEEQRAFVIENNSIASAFPAYLKRCKYAQTMMNLEISKINQDLDVLKELIFEGFSELKRFEIVRDRRLQKMKDEQSRREDIAFDEMGINIHMKNQSKL
jgi:flagellar protein FliJ